MIHTPLCDLLGIRYPVFQGGMAWIADGKLAAAVSEGGGLGIIAAGNAKVLNLMSNLTSFVLLVYWGKILYIYGAAMAVCLFAGAYFGSRLAIRRGTAFVRAIMLVVTTVLIVKLALDYAGLL